MKFFYLLIFSLFLTSCIGKPIPLESPAVVHGKSLKLHVKHPPRFRIYHPNAYAIQTIKPNGVVTFSDLGPANRAGDEMLPHLADPAQTIGKGLADILAKEYEMPHQGVATKQRPKEVDYVLRVNTLLWQVRHDKKRNAYYLEYSALIYLTKTANNKTKAYAHCRQKIDGISFPDVSIIRAALQKAADGCVGEVRKKISI